jgi:hypothetical protein
MGRQWRDCRLLVAGLILIMMLFPAMGELVRPVLLTSVIAAVLVAGVALVRPGRRRVIVAAVIALFQVVLTGVSASLNTDSFSYPFASAAAFGITAALIVYCIYCVLKYVLQARRISRDQVFAGISIYLMLGLAFGCLYYVLGARDGSSFAVGGAKVEDGRTPDLMYFSFITLATLGYGDITPVTKSARTLAELEALAGSLYMAVFMARLVSLVPAAKASDEQESTISR